MLAGTPHTLVVLQRVPRVDAALLQVSVAAALHEGVPLPLQPPRHRHAGGDAKALPPAAKAPAHCDTAAYFVSLSSAAAVDLVMRNAARRRLKAAGLRIKRAPWADNIVWPNYQRKKSFCRGIVTKKKKILSL